MTGWNLPPGVTARMIDEAQGAGVCRCEDLLDAMVEHGLPRDIAEQKLEHEPCDFCEAEARAEADEAAQEDAAFARWEARREREE